MFLKAGGYCTSTAGNPVLKFPESTFLVTRPHHLIGGDLIHRSILYTAVCMYVYLMLIMLITDMHITPAQMYYTCV